MTTLALFVALAILLGLTTLQFLLVLGLPLGDYAWGGKHRVLPPRLRIAAGIAIVLYVLFAALLLSRGAILGDGKSIPIVIGTWVLFGYATLSILPNVASKSRRERATQIPVSALLAISIGFVAASTV